MNKMNKINKMMIKTKTIMMNLSKNIQRSQIRKSKNNKRKNKKRNETLT